MDDRNKPGVSRIPWAVSSLPMRPARSLYLTSKDKIYFFISLINSS